MLYKDNPFDCLEISEHLYNQYVLIELIRDSPTFISEGFFAKGKLNSNEEDSEENVISITLIIKNYDIRIPYEDILSITPLC